MKLNSSQVFKLGKVFSYCELKGFLSRKLSEELSLGYLGAQLKRNVTAEWRKSMQQNENYHILPGPISKNDTFAFYPTASKLLQNQEPFGYFHSTISENIRNEIIFDKKFYDKWDKSDLMGLQVLFFCSRKKSGRWFDYWSRERLSWWRKFCGTPAKLQFDDIVSTSETPDIKIMFNVDGIKIPVEVISNYSPETLCNNLKSEFNLILCETLSENVTLSLLTDAYHEKNGKSIMRLHHKIAPFKLAILVNSCDDFDTNKKLKALAVFISRELRQVDIFSYPNPNISTQKESLEKQFETFDEIGVPYVIVIDDNVLKSGIVGIRNRDTMLREQVHVSEIKKLLLRYLQQNFYEE